MDIYGDVIGSDGHSLVFYMDDGTLKPVIRMSDWVYPIFRYSFDSSVCVYLFTLD